MKKDIVKSNDTSEIAFVIIGVVLLAVTSFFIHL